MASASKSNVPAIFELKSAALTLISVVLKTAALDDLARELRDRFAGTPGLFEHDPVVIDLSQIREAPQAIDFAALVALLREHVMVPVAVKGGSESQMAAALDAGLAEAPEGVQPTLRTQDKQPPDAGSAAAAEPAPTAVSALNTLILDRPLRSGQQVYARGADLVVMAAVSFGAEVIADGNIHVYAPLRGRAIAGARGNASARIFTTCLEAQLVSIAGTYRTTDTPLPPDVLGKPAQVRLDGDTLLIEPLTA